MHLESSAIKFYIRLRKRIIDRKLVEFGIQPILAYILAPLFFIAISFFLFYKTEYAVYLYVVYAIFNLLQIGDQKRNDFLKMHFGDAQFRYLRSVENILIVAPFVLFLIYKLEFVAVVILLFAALALSLFNTDVSKKLYFATPFGKYPFEFATGFRKLFPVYLGACFLLAMSVAVSNFNLGLFAFVLVVFLCMSFYSEPENPFYVWIYKKTSMGFLRHKCLVACGYLSILLIPLFLVLTYYFSEYVYICIGALTLSYIYLMALIVFKYVRFPQQLSLGQVILLTLSYLFPPLLLFTLIYYLPKANRNLEEYLG